jgi:hypothetical protein
MIKALIRERDKLGSSAVTASHLSMRVPVSSGLASNEKVIRSLMAENTTQNSSETTATIGSEEQPFMSARTLAMLKFSIVVMTVLIAAGVIALVIGLKRKAETLAPAGDAVLQLPAGAKITALSSDENGLWLLIENKEGQQSLRRLDEAATTTATIAIQSD